MAILNKPDIQVLIDAYTVKVDSVIVANGNKDITGPILNDVFQDTIEILTDIKDSYYNLLSETRTAASTSYDSTATTSFWNLPIPTNSQEAHDQEIERISTIENSIPLVEKQPFYINSDDTVSGLQAFQGPIVIDPLSEIISSNLTGGFYEYSNDGVSFSSVGGTDTLSDLATFITGNVGVFFIRAYGVYSGNGLAIIQFNYTK